MAGQAETAGVRVAVAVAEDEIGPDLEAPEGLHHRRQSRNERSPGT